MTKCLKIELTEYMFLYWIRLFFIIIIDPMQISFFRSGSDLSHFSMTNRTESVSPCLWHSLLLSEIRQFCRLSNIFPTTRLTNRIHKRPNEQKQSTTRHRQIVQHLQYEQQQLTDKLAIARTAQSIHGCPRRRSLAKYLFHSVNAMEKCQRCL